MKEEEKLKSFNEENKTKIKIDDKNISIEHKKLNEDSLIICFLLNLKSYKYYP